MSESIPFEMIKILNQLEDLEKRMAAIEARGKRKPKSLLPVVSVKPGHQLVTFTPSVQFQLSEELVASWKDTYPAEFITEAWKGARNWVLVNPHKAPKSRWGVFLNTWMKNEWERYRKTLNGQKPRITEDELLSILRGHDAEDGRVREGAEGVGDGS